jgi:hypothetical protein
LFSLKQDSGELEVEALVANGPAQNFAHEIMRGDVLVEVMRFNRVNHNVDFAMCVCLQEFQ